MSILGKSKLLDNQLAQLSPDLRKVFAVDCAMQYLSRYEAWSKDEGAGWGQPARLTDAIELIWLAIETGEVSQEQIEAQIEAVYEVTPDTEIFPIASSVGALDAACSVCDALQCAVDGSIEAARRAGQSAMFASEMLLVKEIRADALKESPEEAMEWARQQRVIAVLREWGDQPITRADFNKLIQP